nr:MAG TPA: hypothetical protein [Bacteriophage sp.]
MPEKPDGWLRNTEDWTNTGRKCYMMGSKNV